MFACIVCTRRDLSISLIYHSIEISTALTARSRISKQSISLLYAELKQKPTKNSYIFFLLSKDWLTHYGNLRYCLFIFAWKWLKVSIIWESQIKSTVWSSRSHKEWGSGAQFIYAACVTLRTALWNTPPPWPVTGARYFLMLYHNDNWQWQFILVSPTLGYWSRAQSVWICQFSHCELYTNTNRINVGPYKMSVGGAETRSSYAHKLT